MLYSSISAQHWSQVGGGIKGNIDKLITDSSANLLYAIGNFSTVGSVPAIGVAQWDGTKWDSLKVFKGPILDAYGYKDTLLIVKLNFVIRLYGGNIDTIAVFTDGRSARQLLQYNGHLVVVGNFDSINNIPIHSVAWWDGNNWNPFDTTRFDEGITRAIEYQGELYAGGNFSNYNGSLKRLARWNGSQWLPVGNGIKGGMASIGSFEIYNGDLYIGGAFRVVDGNPSNCVARWNGAQWMDVAGGLYSASNWTAVWDMKVFDGYLYAVGEFSLSGNLPIRAVARWDGAKWCGFGLSSTRVSTIEVYNHEMYIGGIFTTLGIDSIAHVAKWIGGNYTDTCTTPVGISEDIELSAIGLHPNPASTQLSLTIPPPTLPAAAIITDVNGRLLCKEQLLNATNTLNIAELPAGLYFVTVQNAGQRWVRRFVKQ